MPSTPPIDEDTFQGLLDKTLADLGGAPTKTAAVPIVVSDEKATLPVAQQRRITIALLGAFVLIAIIIGAFRSGAAPTHDSAPTVLPSVVPTEVTSPTVAPPTAVPILGYWAPTEPNGFVIDTTKIVRVIDVQRGWARVEMDGGGLIWTATSAVPQDMIARYTPPTPIPPSPRPYVPPVPTDPPPPCLNSGIPGKMVSVCGWGDLAQEARDKWLATYGGNAGIVLTPSPEAWNR